VNPREDLRVEEKGNRRKAEENRLAVVECKVSEDRREEGGFN
jgi:hypothetical protein